MIWDYDVRVIVMLTAESEGGQLKCHNYWSDKNFGPYVLKSLSEKRVSLDPKQHKHHRHESTAVGPSRDPATSEPNIDPFRLRKRAMTNIDDITPAGEGPGTPSSERPFAIVRKFSLSHAGFPFSQMREITQVHYTSWPDFGAPAQPSQVLALVELCGKLSNGPVIGENTSDSKPENRPVLVHCSAGCGRTGTFCTIDSVLDMLRKQAKEKRNGTLPPQPLKSEAASRTFSPVSRLNPVDELSPSSNMDFFSNHHNHHANGRISLDTEMMEGVEREKENGDDWMWNEDIDLVEKTVMEFREQRISMVQSLKQYVLCYETVLEWLTRQASNRPPGLARRQSEF